MEPSGDGEFIFEYSTKFRFIIQARFCESKKALSLTHSLPRECQDEKFIEANGDNNCGVSSKVSLCANCSLATKARVQFFARQKVTTTFHFAPIINPRVPFEVCACGTFNKHLFF
jgi:hypothetical protein